MDATRVALLKTAKLWPTQARAPSPKERSASNLIDSFKYWLLVRVDSFSEYKRRKG